MKLRSYGHLPIEPQGYAQEVESPVVWAKIGRRITLSDQSAASILAEVRGPFFQCLCEKCRTPLFSTDERKAYWLCSACEGGRT